MNILEGKARKHEIVHCNADINSVPILTPQLSSYSTADIQSPANVTNPDGLAPITFPWQLHLLLDDAETKGFSHVVSWLEGGAMFKVHKPKEFADRVMPCYFNQTRYKSFQRQLNSYRFRRFVAGKNKGTCFHELFMRDQPELCRHINRVKVSRGRPAAAAQEEVMSHAKLPQHPADNDESCDRVKTISNFCSSIPPMMASEIVSIFGSPSWDHGGGDTLFHTHCT
jgi:hypothetical protein